MEFKHSKPERRHDRRICPNCQALSGTQSTCKLCGAATEARLRITWYVNGKRERELTRCWRPEDAAAILQRKEADYWRQQDLGVEREIGGTLREAFDAFVATKARCSDNYTKQINTALRAFGDGFGWDRSVTQVTPRDIHDFKEDGLLNRSTTTVRSYMLVLRRFFGHLHEEGWIRRNPAKKVKLPPARKGRDFLRPDEIVPVLQRFWETEVEIAPIITTFILGGWRKGELVNLRRPDVMLAERWAYVVEFEGDEVTASWSPKSASSHRAVPLHPMVAQALKRVAPVTFPDGKPSPWVFPITDARKSERFVDRLGRRQSVCGDRRSPGTSVFGDKVREVLADLGIGHRVTIHGLRRTFAVLMQEAGAPDSVIRQALGHKAQGVMESHYLPRRDETVKRWVDAIEVTIPALTGDCPIPPQKAGSGPILPLTGTSGGSHCPRIAPSSGENQPPYLRLVK